MDVASKMLNRRSSTDRWVGPAATGPVTLQNENSTPMRAMRGGRMALTAPYVELDT